MKRTHIRVELDKSSHYDNVRDITVGRQVQAKGFVQRYWQSETIKHACAQRNAHKVLPCERSTNCQPSLLARLLPRACRVPCGSAVNVQTYSTKPKLEDFSVRLAFTRERYGSLMVSVPIYQYWNFFSPHIALAIFLPKVLAR